MRRPINPLYDLRREQRQIDLFTTISLSGAAAVPEWADLPKEARQALTSLLTRLILEHASKDRAPRLKETVYDR